MTHAEKVARARELRDQGLKLREIGERMGVAASTVHAWMAGPDVSQLWARQRVRDSALTELAAAAAAVERLPALVAAAREQGATWQQIADVFGVSRQAAHQRFADANTKGDAG